jgi:hypothetical protein
VCVQVVKYRDKMSVGSSLMDSMYGSYTSPTSISANARYDALFDAVGSTGYSRYRGPSYSTTYSSREDGIIQI